MVTQGVLFTGFFTAIAVQHDKGKWGRLLPRTTHASPWRREGIVKGEEVRWPQSGLIIICSRRRHHTYSLFTITSYFKPPLTRGAFVRVTTRVAPTTLFQPGRRGGPAWPPGKGTSSGPPGHLPLRGEGICRTLFKPPLTGEVPRRGGGVCLPPWRGRKSEE